MDAAWIEALTELWKNDEDIDYRKLEAEYQLKPLQRRGLEASLPPEQGPLLICLTGFGDQRDSIATKITENGALYTGDLTRRCSHLIVNKPEGKKFTAAKSWGVRTVTLAWLDQSIDRGLILEETKYDPLFPAEEQGRDAWIRRDKKRPSVGKRSRSTAVDGQQEGARKLRKTASMKLSSQQNNLWGDILGESTSREYSFAQDDASRREEQSVEQPSIPTAVTTGIFSNCVFCLHGFSTKQAEVLEQTIASLDGATATSLTVLQESGNESQTRRKFLIVPQTARPDTYPSSIPGDVNVITEFFIEKCLHSKQFSNPHEHALGRPCPSFPIEGFSNLTICTAAFTGLELYHVAKSIKQLGATLEEQFRPSASLLLCKSLDSLRKDKLKYAIEWKVPVVSADWLWESISTGRSAPIGNFIYPSLRKLFPKQQHETQPTQPAQSNPIQRTRSEPSTKSSKSSKSDKPPPVAGIDTTAFDKDAPVKKAHIGLISDAFNDDDSEAAMGDKSNRTTSGDTSEAPLSELSPASLNKSPPPTKPANPTTYRKPSSDSDSSRKSNTSKKSEEGPPKARGEDQVRKAARNVEREQLTSRLTSLLDSAAPSPDIDPSAGTAPVAPKARKRQILGRAMSNASNASSAAGAAPDSFKKTVSALQAEEDDGDQEQPPPTQVQYHDPQAQERRRLLMSKMMGQSASEETASGRNLRTRSG